MRLMVLAKQQQREFGLLQLQSEGNKLLREQIAKKQLVFQLHRHGRQK